jgi:hypothetical protein
LHVSIPSRLFIHSSENHRTKTSYDNALIIKLFAFSFANSYSSCFYIAFFRGVCKKTKQIWYAYSYLFRVKIPKLLMSDGADGHFDWCNSSLMIILINNSRETEVLTRLHCDIALIINDQQVYLCRKDDDDDREPAP